jgi:hypothetical protein
MTTWPVRGSPTGGPRRNSTALDAACRVRDGSRRLAAAVLAVLAAGAGLALLARRLDGFPPAVIHGKVRNATLLQPR